MIDRRGVRAAHEAADAYGGARIVAISHCRDAGGRSGPHRWPWRLLAAAVAGTALGCAAQPGQYTVRPAASPLPQPPSTEVYFYPRAGQGAARQDRDRYECYLWAVQQTGFDPSQPQLAPHQRVEVVPVPPPGQDTAAGALAGAAIGAVVARPRDAFAGAVAGAVTGAAIGAASDAARQEQAARVQRSYDEEAARQAARNDRLAREYRRAMAACLEGRGYTVR